MYNDFMIDEKHTLELRGISKQYTVSDKIITGISNVNLKFNDNEFVVISGASGSGKSTLLNIIAGIDNYTDGYVVCKGYNTDFFGEHDWGEYRKNHVSYVHQNFYLLDNLTVYQNIENAYLLNYDKEKAKEIIYGIIDKVGLSKQINQKAKELSGGQKQRVAIARALAKGTGIILADEPTGNLDSKSTNEIVQLLSEISKDNLVIVVTHNLDAFKEYATRHIKIDNGKIFEDNILVNTNINLDPVSKDIKAFNNKHIKNNQKMLYTLKSIMRNNKKQALSLFFITFTIMLLLTLTYGIIQDIMTIVNPDVNSSGVWRYVKDDRLIIRKMDTTKFTYDERNNLLSMQEIDYIIPNDYPLDFAFHMEVKQYDQPISMNVYIRPINMFKGTIDKGTSPSSDNDVIIECFYDLIFDWGNENLKLLNEQIPHTEIPINIAGISNIYASGYFDYCYMYVSEELFQEIYAMTMQAYTLLNVLEQEDTEEANAIVLIDNSLTNGELMVSTGFTKEISNNISFALRVKNNDFANTKDFSVKGIKDLPYNIMQEESIIYMNSEDYSSLYRTEDIYQISLILNDSKNYNKVKDKFISRGYSVYYPYSSLNMWQKDEVIIKFFIRLLMLAISIAIVFASMLLINNSIKRRLKSYLILKSIGYNSSVLSRTAILETSIPIIIAGITTFIALLIWNFIVIFMLKNSYSASFSPVKVGSLIFVCGLTSLSYLILINIKMIKGLKMSILNYLRGVKK